jgi:NAD(P)-dependent dehydrogenase (short-subunit alcohol dehydrogenase family)
LSAELIEAGFTVVGAGRRQSALAETAAILGDRFQPVVLDVSDATATQRVFSERIDANGPLAILINNAAVYPHRDIMDETPDSFAKTIQINLGGVLNCSHAALQDMAPRGVGRILNVASMADIDPLPCSAAYSVSKGAATILTRAMVADLGDRFPGIVIGDWLPGMLQTSMGIPDGLNPETAAKWGGKLAQMNDPGLNGAVFEMGAELLPHRGLRGKIKDFLLMRKRKPRQL